MKIHWTLDQQLNLHSHIVIDAEIEHDLNMFQVQSMLLEVFIETKKNLRGLKSIPKSGIMTIIFKNDKLDCIYHRFNSDSG